MPEAVGSVLTGDRRDCIHKAKIINVNNINNIKINNININNTNINNIKMKAFETAGARPQRA